MKTALLLLSITLSFGIKAQDQLLKYISSDHKWVTQNNWDLGTESNRGQAHQLDSTIKSFYDSPSSDWVKSEIKTFTYYPNGGIKTISKELVENSLEEMEYNADGNILCRITKSWDGIQYVPDFKTLYYYHANGDSKIDSLFTHDPLGWRAVAYNTYILNVNGEVAERWSFGLASNLPMAKILFYYNSMGKIASIDSYSYVIAQWEKLFRSKFTYDFDEREIELIEQTWDQGSWKNVMKLESEWQNGNLSNVKWYSWSQQTWFKNFESTYSYNTNISSSNVLFPSEFSMNQNKILGRTGVSNFTIPGEVADSTQFFYSGSIASSNEITKLKDVFLLRNPVQNQLLINNQNQKSCEILIYDNVGKLLTQVESGERVISTDVNFFKTGIYFIKVRSSHQEKVLKFYKE